MNWRNPEKEFPVEDQNVFVLICHGKMNYPGSFSILGAIVDWVGENGFRCDENDDRGAGAASQFYGVGVDGKKFDYASGDLIIAWIPAEEFIFPNFVKPDGHNNDLVNKNSSKIQAALKVARETLSRIKATDHTELCNYISTIRKCDCHVGDAIAAITEIETLLGLKNR